MAHSEDDVANGHPAPPGVFRLGGETQLTSPHFL